MHGYEKVKNEVIERVKLLSLCTGINTKIWAPMIMTFAPLRKAILRYDVKFLTDYTNFVLEHKEINTKNISSFIFLDCNEEQMKELTAQIYFRID